MDETGGAAERVRALISACGIPLCGVCGFDAVRERLLPCAAARRLPENARSVLMCAFPYLVETGPRNLSRYAAVPDYHAVCGALLDRAAQRLAREFPGRRFEPFVDNSPIPEVYAAARAGLGVVGDNGLLITREYGSWVFLGELVTDLALPQSSDAAELPTCPHCGRCAAACPSATGVGDKSACLSALTQQKRPLSSDEAARVARSGCAWGCDICQECCPCNAHAAVTPLAAFSAGARPVCHAGDDFAGRAYAWRPREVIERNLRLIAGKIDGGEI